MKEMKKKRRKFILISHTIFPFDVLFTTASYEDVVKYISKNKKYTLNDEEKTKLKMSGRGKTIMLIGEQTIIRVRPSQTKIGVDIIDVVHEIVHAVFFIAARIGLRYAEESEEFFTYYQGYLLKEILKVLDP